MTGIRSAFCWSVHPSFSSETFGQQGIYFMRGDNIMLLVTTLVLGTRKAKGRIQQIIQQIKH